MSKTILKLRLNDYWKIGEHESWFSDMAKQGLHLKETGVIFTRFEKGEPKNTKYRIEVTRGGISYERNALYSEFGWDFVTFYGKFCVYSSPEELNAPELHTEPEEQSYTLSTLNKDMRWTALIVSIFVVIFFAMMFSMFFLSKTPFENFVTGDSSQQLILTLVESYVLVSTLQGWFSIRALRKSLLEGKPIDHHADWRKSRRRSNVISLFIIVLSLFSLLLPVMSMIRSETSSLPTGNTNLPIVRLAELENNSALKPNPGFASDGIDRSNLYETNWSILAPIQYIADENGLIEDMSWNDGSGLYSPSIHTQYYKLRFSGMADGLLKDLMKRHLYEERQRLKLQKIESDIFDQLYVMADEEEKQIFASLENEVLYIRYYGYADRDKILSLAESCLNNGIVKDH